MPELWQLLHWPHHSGRRHFISTLVKEMPQKLHEQLTHSSWLLLTLRIPLNWAHEEQSITVSETRRLPVFQLVPTGLLQAMANHQEAIVYSWQCWQLEFPMSRMLPPFITERHLLWFVYKTHLFLKKKQWLSGAWFIYIKFLKCQHCWRGEQSRGWFVRENSVLRVELRFNICIAWTWAKQENLKRVSVSPAIEWVLRPSSR